MSCKTGRLLTWENWRMFYFWGIKDGGCRVDGRLTACPSGAICVIMLLVILAALTVTACAAPSTRVVNGIVADPHSWPWQLSLQLDNQHICGAVVLNKDFALTAAHCVDFAGYPASRFSVVCGAHDILNTEEATQQRSVASAIRMHEAYDGNANGFPNDIALIKLSTPLSLNSECRTAALPANDNKDYASKMSTITGWGRLSGGGPAAQLLKEAPIPVISYSDCRSRWGIFFNPIMTTHICVYDPSGLHGACNGDSGGPLVSPDYDTGLVTVTGVTSFGRSGCDTSYPSVYTRVSSYLGWIDSNMAAM